MKELLRIPEKRFTFLQHANTSKKDTRLKNRWTKKGNALKYECMHFVQFSRSI